MGLPKSSDESIYDIMKYIEDGDYRVPRFQRDFVWDVKKSAELIDSIFRGFPIGSVIIWNTKTALSEIRDFGGIKIPGKKKGRYTSYIIDGQQRLTSIYFAMKGLKTGNGQDFSKICVCLTSKGDEQIVYSEIPKDADEKDFILLKDLYSREHLNGHLSNRKLYYDKIMNQYNVSVIEIDDESLGMEQVVEIFERLNLGGKKLSMFSIIAARSYDEKSGFDLTRKYEELNNKLVDSNYGKINDAVFLQIIAACLIGRVKKADILKKLKDSDIRNSYDKIEKALLEAIDHLKGEKYGVSVSALLPYERLLVPFTYFHYKQGSRQITKTKESYLLDFFWRCVITKRYGGSADTNTEADLTKIQLILKGDKPSQESIVLSPQSIVEEGRFVLTSGFAVGMLCLMAQAHPKSFAEGRTIDITNEAVSNSSKKQYHHFFPKQSPVILKNKEYKAYVNNVVNIIFMDAVTNTQISNKNPSKYIREFSKKSPRLSNKLKSHYISRNGYGIDENDYFAFLNARSKAMYQKLRTYIIPNRRDVINGDLPFV